MYPPALDRDELSAWLRLAHTPGIGRALARRLLAQAGSIEALFAQSPTALGAQLAPAQPPAHARGSADRGRPLLSDPDTE